MQQKTIKLNPEFLSVSGNSMNKKDKTRKVREKKIKPKPFIKPNKLRKQLLARIKDYQKNNEQQEIKQTNNNKLSKKDNELSKKDNEFNDEFNNEFNKSLNFLTTLSQQKKTKKNKKKHQQQQQLDNYINVSTELPKSMIDTHSNHSIQNNISIKPNIVSTSPDQIKPNNISIKPNIVSTSPDQINNNIPNPVIINNPSQNNHNISINNKLPEPPPYGCLKNGKKPTYKQWCNKTIKQNHHNTHNTHNTHNINSRHSIVIENYSPNKDISEREKILNKIKKNYATKKKLTKTYKYQLGKRNNIVGVLIKDRKTRKLIQHEHGLLKQKKLPEIKNYLRNKNLLKSSSNAPNDVVREIYEQSILAGDLENKTTDTLLHNFLNT